jgi:hypothetical protein
MYYVDTIREASELKTSVLQPLYYMYTNPELPDIKTAGMQLMFNADTNLRGLEIINPKLATLVQRGYVPRCLGIINQS